MFFLYPKTGAYQHPAFYENDAESLYTLEMPSGEEGIYVYADGDGIRMEAGGRWDDIFFT